MHDKDKIMKTFKETFDENIWDRTKAKAAGAVAGAKSWAGQTARNVMGKDPADAGQAGAAAKLQAQADSLSKGAATKLQKLLADVKTDMAKLGGFDDYNETIKFNPSLQQFLDNIDANIKVLAAGKVELSDAEKQAHMDTGGKFSGKHGTPIPATPDQAAQAAAAKNAGNTEPGGQQTLGI